MVENIKTNSPRYYQDWLRLFDSIKKYGMSDEYFEILSNGSLDDGKFSIINFEKQLVSFINTILTLTINRFIKEINLMFELNDIFGIKRKLISLKRQIEQMMFFNNLKFLEQNYVDELNKSLRENVTEFYNLFIKKIKEQTVENENIYELYYILKKNNI